MDCKTARQIIPLYASADVDQTEAQMLDEHLNSCQECAKLLESYRASIALLASFSVGQAPEGTFEGFYADLRERILLSGAFALRRRNRIMVTAIRAVSVAAVILVALFIWFRAQESQPVATQRPEVKPDIVRVQEVKTVEPIVEEVLVPRGKTGGLEMEECELLSEWSGGSDF